MLRRPSPAHPAASRSAWGRALAAALALPLAVGALPAASAVTAAEPDVVVLVGTLQSEIGCPGDWQTDCLESTLAPVDGSPDLYRGTFDVPAGDYAYKVALNGSFDENYGADGEPGGANIALAAAGGPVTFTYDDATKRITAEAADAPAERTATVAGDFQSELGCGGDFVTQCPQTRLQPVEGSPGLYRATFDIPAGSYRYKVVIDESFDEAHPANDVPLVAPGGEVTFTYDDTTKTVTDSVNAAEEPGEEPGVGTRVVTLVGLLQSEVGCPGDWNTECDLTRMQPVAGSPDLYRVSLQLPAGRYEVKVVIDESFAENYGAGGAPGGANIPVNIAEAGTYTFTFDDATKLLTDDVPDPVDAQAGAHWLATGTIAWETSAFPAGTTYQLHTARDGGLVLADGTVTGGTAVELTRDALGGKLTGRFPHLRELEALRVPREAARRSGELLQGQLAVAAVGPDGRVLATSGVQVPGVLDELYAGAARAELGPVFRRGVPSLAVWAPTARSVTLLRFTAGSGGEPVARTPMAAGRDGVWSATGDAGWAGSHYLYEVEVYVPETGRVERNVVTDPYSTALSTNSERSLLVDLADPALAPAGWDRLAKPALAQPEDLAVYELHVRDFSVTDATVPAELRGTYRAFTASGSDGMRRLQGLAAAGVNAVHLLPVNDMATVDEVRSNQQQPACDLESFAPDSEQQQACVGTVAARDGFNWGYDPLHYTAPEGSYATDPEGAVRTREFREMVAALNATGMRVVQDVVYNHTSSAGQTGGNDLDRIVPGYYHRLDPTTGAVETSTCCANTATEHVMMGDLVVDSIVTLARTYKLDGFRFDLMGHHPKQNILDVRRALDALTVQRDGVDGKGIYLYGEGWEFGEVAGDARFVQATQDTMGGTGVGTFNDRLRDAVRGGTVLDEDPRAQGFASGLFTDPSGAEVNGTEAEQRERLLLAHDQIKVGLTGNLEGYRFVDRTGATVTGAQVDYEGAPAGYTEDPQEAITYVEAHDNTTLFDALALKLPQDTSMADRVRMQTLALGTTAFSQGVVFWHAGAETLRSKSLDENSYDSGDWFNVLDHTGTDNGFGRGLPPEADNGETWDVARPLLADPALRPAPADIAAASARARELLAIRRSSPLFTLGTARSVQERVSFPTGGPEQTPGVIVMRLDDAAGRDLDPAREGLVVVFNASDEATTQAVPGTAGSVWALHPVQAAGADEVVKGSAHDAAAGTFTVPARTVAVFEAP